VVMKYRFSRKNWYIGDLWNTGHDMNEVRQWCAEQFGPQDKAPMLGVVGFTTILRCFVSVMNVIGCGLR
jgi:hypothetical protein